MKRFAPAILLCLPLLLSCVKVEELTLEEIESLNAEGLAEILAKTVSKPWRGEDFKPGRPGGVWRSALREDPKTFNLLVSEGDSASGAVVGSMHDYLVDYDVVRRAWQPRLASFEVIPDEQNNTLTVRYTLRDDLYWSYYGSDKKVKVTSDDVIFWYNEISGDEAMRSSSYYQQYLLMPDDSEAHVDIRKLDNRRFEFRFPRIVADPLLATNMDFGPRVLYEPAKKAGGADAVRALFSVDSDPKLIPSLGEWFLTEYTPGQRLVYKRNPGYWRKDARGVSIPYVEENIARIIPDENTQLLLFKQGETETYGLRPEDLDDLVLSGENRKRDYTVFNAEGASSAPFWSFNQNPQNKNRPQYEWFTQKEFRQAMSCLLNRDRIIAQVYRGLAEPMFYLFPEPNPYYNPDITLEYRYDPRRAGELLASIGIKPGANGVMRDAQGRAVEFDLTIRSDSGVNNDIASIIRDELSKAGIKVNIRILDFQKLVDQLMGTFEWDSMIIGLSGSGIFPSQGSNVWPSSGNLHLWNPNQETPATEWEARLDRLYNEGCYTINREKAAAIWDEFQRILLEQCPIIYLMRSRGFWALQNRWDMTNVYYDNRNGAETAWVYLQ
jgi:peptide/nickel transport system substrate-binding protein